MTVEMPAVGNGIDDGVDDGMSFEEGGPQSTPTAMAVRFQGDRYGRRGGEWDELLE